MSLPPLPRICFLAWLTWAQIGGANAYAASQPTRPNILFILLDDLRSDALGCMGHSLAKTPHIDRVAREGALFKNFFATTPLCSPSRGSFLTGQYAHTHKVTTNRDESKRSHELITFPLRLQKAGYETAGIGKWHMGEDDSPRPGFNHWVSFKGQGVYENPTLNVNGTVQPRTGYLTDILNQAALDFIKAPHAKPFLLYFAHKAIHAPNIPAKRHEDIYTDGDLSFAPSVYAVPAGKSAILPARRNKNAPGQPGANAAAAAASRDRSVRTQLRTLAAVDDGVGLLLKALENSGQLDHTVVIFTSDNGLFWGEHGLDSKRLAYEESIRVPLLMRYPKLIRAGTIIDQSVLNIDIAPTLLDIGGAPVPANMQGRSLLPLLKSNRAPWRTSFLAEYFAEGSSQVHPAWYAVRTNRWKYIRYTELPAADEFYDLQADPYEMKNLVASPGAQRDLIATKAELERLMKETGAK